MTRQQHKPQREPRTLAQQLSAAETVCDLCGDATSEPTTRGRWRTCPACTRRLINLDAKASRETTT